jgi:hypothetical protein
MIHVYMIIYNKYVERVAFIFLLNIIMDIHEGDQGLRELIYF